MVIIKVDRKIVTLLHLLNIRTVTYVNNKPYVLDYITSTGNEAKKLFKQTKAKNRNCVIRKRKTSYGTTHYIHSRHKTLHRKKRK